MWGGGLRLSGSFGNQLWLSGLGFWGLGSRVSNFRRLRGRGAHGQHQLHAHLLRQVGMVTGAKTVSIVSQLQVVIASYMCMYIYIYIYIYTYTLYICLSVTLLMTLETPLLNRHEP